MKLLLFIKILFSYVFVKFVDFRNRINYKLQYPTSRFHLGATLLDTNLEGTNILFQDTYILSSTLGRFTYVQKRTTIINARIGKFCSIASNVSIGPGIHKIDGVSTHPAFYLNNTPLIKTYCSKDLFVSSKKTIIGHDVWIGEGVIVMDGIHIGTGAIIAAGAVVTKNVPAYSIVGGVPANIIRYRFNAETINSLLQSDWWDFEDDWFEKNSNLMLDPAEFLNNHKK